MAAKKLPIFGLAASIIDLFPTPHPPRRSMPIFPPERKRNWRTWLVTTMDVNQMRWTQMSLLLRWRRRTQCYNSRSKSRAHHSSFRVTWPARKTCTTTHFYSDVIRIVTVNCVFSINAWKPTKKYSFPSAQPPPTWRFWISTWTTTLQASGDSSMLKWFWRFFSF